jgi:uncharacterized protein
MTDRDQWQQWQVSREKRLRKPHGLLALTGTHWLDEEPAPIEEGGPVLWSGDGKTITVTASADHGLILDGEPIDGTVTLYPDTAANPSTVTVPDGDLLLIPIEREGVSALRVYDPGAEARTSFDGIDAFDYVEEWAIPADFTPYAAARSEQVLNADGVYRGLDLRGTVTFELEDGPDGPGQYSLAVGYNADGTLHTVFADGTSGNDTFKFRFLDMSAPDDEGRTVIDFNRAYLPPCAFADHYLCPVPPRGNTLAQRVEAGERAVRRH